MLPFLRITPFRQFKAAMICERILAPALSFRGIFAGSFIILTAPVLNIQFTNRPRTQYFINNYRPVTQYLLSVTAPVLNN